MTVPMRWRLGGGFAVGAVALAVCFALLATARPVAAQAIQTSQASVTSRDPTSVAFSLRVNTPSGLKSARLEYAVRNPDGNVGGGGDGRVGPGAETDVSFTLTTRDNTRYIPVGSVLLYHWALEANDGSRMSTPEQEYLFLDGRFQWRNQTDGQVTVYWYGGNENQALAALRATKSAVDDTSKLLETKVTYPMRVVVYRNEEDGTLARRPQSATFDAQVNTGGQRVAPDLIFVFANVPDVVRHEAAHIVTHVAGDGPFVNVPSWLDEGTAVYMQGDPGGYRPAVELAVRADRTLSLRSMQSPTSRPGEVDIFYGQSWSTVKFLIDEYGQPKFAELYRTIFKGARVDDALKTVYGFDQDGLYNAWRQKNGLRPVATSAPTNSGPAVGAQATRAPLGVPTSVSAAGGQATAAGSGAPAPATSDDDESGSNATGAVIVLAVTVLLAAALGGGGFALLRSRGRRRAA